MTKTVFSAQEVPHIFTTAPDAIARNAGHSLSCDSGVLYSYRAPIAAWHKGKILISTESHSVTTSKHQSWAHYATRHLECIFLPDLRFVLGNISVSDCARYITNRLKEIEALRGKKGRARSEWRKDAIEADIAELENACAFVWKERAGKRTAWESAVAVDEKARVADAKARYRKARATLESGTENAARILEDARARFISDGERMGGLFPSILENAQSDINRLDQMGAARGLGITSTATFSHAARLMGKKWAVECTRLAIDMQDIADSLQPEIDAARAEIDAKRLAANAEKIAAWKKGKSGTLPYGLPVMCRVVGGDTVQTSMGARVPLGQALRLAGLAKRCREKGQGMDLRGVEVGQYRATRIDARGALTVGCHNIPWESISDAVARFEGAA
jgi:hypothetical protein